MSAHVLDSRPRADRPHPAGPLRRRRTISRARSSSSPRPPPTTSPATRSSSTAANPRGEPCPPSTCRGRRAPRTPRRGAGRAGRARAGAAPARRRLEGGVGGRRARRDGPLRLLVRRARRRRHPHRHALARARVPRARGGARGGSSGSAAVRLPRRARRPRGVRDGARRRRDDRPADRAATRPRQARARSQLAEELAKVHAIPLERAALPPRRRRPRPLRATSSTPSASRTRRSSSAFAGCATTGPSRSRRSSATATSGIGNVVVSERGLEYLLDWEFAHVGDPREDVAWPLVRAWRFGVDGLRLGGVGEVEPYLERYDELTGRTIAARGPVLVGGARQRQVGDRSADAVAPAPLGTRPERRVAVLGRLAAEMEYELLDLLGDEAA